MAGRKDAHTARVGEHGNARSFGKGDQIVAAIRKTRFAAYDNDRALALLQNADCGFDFLRVWCRAGMDMETMWRPDVVRMRPHVKNIDRELEDDGAPPAGHGLSNGQRGEVLDPFGVRDTVRVLHHG